MESPDSVPWSNIIQTALAISFGLWAWLLKKFGEAHVSTIKELVSEMKGVRLEMVKLSERVRAVELHQEWLRERDVP